MRIRLRTIVRRMMLLLVATATFVTGVSAFYFYAASSLLFQPNQAPLETTQSLTPRDAAAPSVKFMNEPPFTFDEKGNAIQQSCAGCVYDEMFGLVVPVYGEYVNHGFGYSVRIPEEVWAMTSTPGEADFGFKARILSDPASVIYVEGRNSTDDAVVEMIDGLRKEFGESVVVLEHKSAWLGGRAGVRYMAQYVDRSTGMTMIEEAVVAVRQDDLDDVYCEVIYSLRLRTPIYNHKENSAVLEKIRRRWRELDLHCGC